MIPPQPSNVPDEGSSDAAVNIVADGKIENAQG
jgi:hypothetical protein